MIKNLLSTSLLVFIVAFAFGQDTKYCGQVEATEKLFERFPHSQSDVKAANEQLEAETNAYRASGGDDEVLIIPTVFHIIHENGEENISDEQIYSAMERANGDFRKLNEDIIDVIEEFEGITSDVQIEFRLAQRDPEGNCHRGINRIFSSLTNDGNDDVKDLITWPRDMYLNVWVVKSAGGAAGYSYLPGSVNNGPNAANDGIVLKHDYTGSIGTSNYFRSRTFTHEIGHWLNLSHPWGGSNSPGEAGNCNMDDQVDDTPLTIGWLSCVLDGESCNSLDNVQNYMEYSYCTRMFTEGQRTRMRAAAYSGIADRNELWEESNLIATGTYNDEQILCEAAFTVSEQIVCLGTEVQFFDDSYHGITEWTWDLGDGTIVNGSDETVHKNPTHSYSEPGTYTVTLTASNGTEDVSTSQEAVVIVMGDGDIGPALVEGFEFDFPQPWWFEKSENEDEEWEVTESAAYDGQHSLKLANNSADVLFATDEIASTTFAMEGESSVWISYRWAFVTRTNETDDRLKVYISSDCGETWSLKELHRGFTDLPSGSPSNFSWTPSSQDDWNEGLIIIDDPEDMTDQFRVKFEFENRGGNNIYLDNINIWADGQTSVQERETLAAVNVFPNPMVDQSILQISLAQNADVVADLFDITGRRVLSIVNNDLNSGKHQFNISKGSLAEGTYLVVVKVEGELLTTERLIIH